MWRIMSLPRTSLAAQWQAALSELPQLLEQLQIALRPSTQHLFATPRVQGDYIVFETAINGDPLPVTLAELERNAVLYEYWLQRKNEFLQALAPHLKLVTINGEEQYLCNAAYLLKLLLEEPQHLFVINGRELVVVPFLDQRHYQHLLQSKAAALAPEAHPAPAVPAGAGAVAGAGAAAAAAGAPAAGATAPVAGEVGAAGAGTVVHRFGLGRWLLLGLLLLGIVGAAWWLYQLWRQSSEESALALLAEQDALESGLASNLALQQKVDLRLEQALCVELCDDVVALERKVDALLQQRLGSTEAELAALNQLHVANLALQAKVAQKLMDAEKAAAQRAAAAAAAEAEAAAAAKAEAASATQLPRCEVIVKEGKMPKLVMAVDGSGSMLSIMPDGSTRMDAAQKAARSLVSSIDNHVPIHLFGMQGCPLARDYGVYSGKYRRTLNGVIARITPQASPWPERVLTPLVSALQGMASVAPAGAESVGILISDGVDTCSQTKRMDLCAVARSIHSAKPKLKIHVVLLGDDAPKAKCVADITGGKVFYPSTTSELIADLKKAGQTLERVCE